MLREAREAWAWGCEQHILTSGPMNYHNELSMCMYDKHAFRELPPGSVYIHTLCVGPLYWWLNDSQQRAILESHFRAQHGGKRMQNGPRSRHKLNADTINLLFMTAWAGNIQGEWYLHRECTAGEVKRRETDAIKLGHAAFHQHQLPHFYNMLRLFRTVVSVLRMSFGQGLCGLCPTLITSIFHWENEK